MEEKIIFLTKEQLKRMIDEVPDDLIPVSVVKSDGSDNGRFFKVGKAKCCVYVDESKSITCEFGDIFNNIALYSISQMDINRLSRNGTEVRNLFLLNKPVGKRKKIL